MSTRSMKAHAATRGDGGEAQRRNRVRFDARLLGLLALGCYVGFIVLAAVKNFIGA